MRIFCFFYLFALLIGNSSVEVHTTFECRHILLLAVYHWFIRLSSVECVERSMRFTFSIDHLIYCYFPPPGSSVNWKQGGVRSLNMVFRFSYFDSRDACLLGQPCENCRVCTLDIILSNTNLDYNGNWFEKRFRFCFSEEAREKEGKNGNDRNARVERKRPFKSIVVTSARTTPPRS